jgi:hypothetical protein
MFVAFDHDDGVVRCTGGPIVGRGPIGIQPRKIVESVVQASFAYTLIGWPGAYKTYTVLLAATNMLNMFLRKVRRCRC